MEKGEQVFEIIRCLYASEIPCAVEYSYIPTSLCPHMTESQVEENGLYKTLQSFGIVPERAVEQLTASTVSREDALLLSIRPEDTVIHIERTTYCASSAFEYTLTTLRCNFFFYTNELK